MASNAELVSPAIAWQSRWRHDVLTTGVRRTKTSVCGRFKVEEHSKRLGGLPTLYLAMHSDGDPRWPNFWEIISRHRKLSAALRACEERAAKQRKA